MNRHQRIATFNAARAAGFSPIKAARYVAYIARFGPILSLEEAVRQVRAAVQ